MGLQNPDFNRITTNTDTVLIAAPGAGKRIHLWSVTVDVEVAGTTSLLRLENGIGGDVIASLDTSDNNNRISRAWHTGKDSSSARGLALSENTAFAAETTGSAAATLNITVVYEIMG
jgi:hypothetical protein